MGNAGGGPNAQRSAVPRLRDDSNRVSQGAIRTAPNYAGRTPQALATLFLPFYGIRAPLTNKAKSWLPWAMVLGKTVMMNCGFITLV